MKKTNKLISILIAVAMLLSMAPLSLTASAADIEVYATGTLGSGSRTAWTIYDNGLLVIDGKGNSVSTKWDSTTASPWKDYADIITRVSFVNCENWECIPECTFRSLSKLKDVTLPENIEEICQYSFTGTAIETILLPDGLITIGYYAFSSCESLKYININDGVTSIGSSAFYNCSSLKAISIPDSVTSIGQTLFQNCTNLEYVRLSENADKVGGSMFSGCTMLKNVSLPASVTVIGSKAFSNASNLEGVYYHGVNEPTTYNPGINNATFSLAPDTMVIYASNDYSATTMGLKANWENDVQTVTKIEGHFVNIAHTANGAVKVGASIVPAGDSVTIDIMAYKNYELDTITVTDSNGQVELSGSGHSRTFSMPEGDVRISATFKSTATPHVHSWTYSANGATITATCAYADTCHNPISKVEISKGNTSSLTFRPDNAKYMTVSGTMEDVVIPDLVYTLKSTGEPTTPINPGVYVASLTIENVTATYEFEITRGNFNYTYFTYTAPQNLTYDGTPKYASVVMSEDYVPYAGEYTVYYNSGTTEPINAGTYTVKVNVAESDYFTAGTAISGRAWRFTIAPKSIEDLTYEGLGTSYPVGATPDVTIKHGDMVLVKDTDYTVEYANNTELGTATMTVTGVGNYTGSKTLEFEIVPHTHSFTYSASGDTITAVCENTDGNCPDSEGTLTILAPADLYADGTTAKEATVENNLVDTSVVVDVTYSTADGNAPTTAGTYTASVTVGGATATVEFTLLNYAAKVTDKDGNAVGTYKTFADAITAAEGSEGSTLTLLDDYNGNSYVNITSGTFTIDLAGKTVTSSGWDTAVMVNGSDVNLTITDSIGGGKIYDSSISLRISAAQCVTIDNGIFERYLDLIKGNLVINGGTFYKGTARYSIGDDDGTNVAIYGGEFPDGFYAYLKSPNDYLADGCYFRDAENRIITVADGATAIKGYVKVEKGAYITDGVITLDSTEFTYNGSEIKPTVIVTVGGKTLTEGTDYTVSYANNVNAGTATVTLIGAGDYKGEATKEFTIVKADNSVIAAPTPNTPTYNGKAHNLISAGEAMYGTMVYSLDGAEYSETIPQGTDAGDYTVYYKVIGDSNHNDIEPATLTVTINAMDISDGFIILGDALTYNGKEQTQTVEKVLLTGTAPEATYTVSGNKATNVGVYLLTVTGTGNFTGEAKIAYEIAVDKSGIEGLTIDYVKSTDKEKVEYVYNQLENAVKDLADEDKIAEWNTLQSYCAAMRQRIYIIENLIEAFENKSGEYDINTVTSDDAADLESFQNSVGKFYNDYYDNLTDEQEKKITDIYSAIEDLEKRISDVAEEITRITNAVNGYDEATVKYSDYKDILQLIDDIEALTDGQNITADERASLEELNTKANLLAAKIRSTADEIARITRAVNAYSIDTVKSSDKADIENLIERIKKLTDGDNITADERANLNELDSTLDALLAKIDETADELARLETEADKYDEATVKSSDLDALNKLDSEIYALALTDNVTAEEKTKLNELHDKVFALITKVGNVSEEIVRIVDAIDAYVFESVKSSDKTDIEKLIADIKALIDGDNITEDERAVLVKADQTADALLEKIAATAEEIKRIDNATNAYDISTVTSADKADIEKLLAASKALQDGDNITEAEEAALVENDETLNALLDRIAATANEIERIDEAVNGYDKETVTSADVPELGKLIDDIKALTDGDNITEDEKAALEEADKAIDDLVEKLAEVAEESKRVDEAVKSYDEETVKSTDKEDLAQLKEDVQALIDSTNTTENEKTAFEEMIKDIEGLEDKIEEIEIQLERIAGIENVYNPETVTSDDKADIENAIAEIETVNPDNLTDEQREEYEEIKAGFEALLDRISAAALQVDAVGEVLAAFDADRVTIFWEDEIEAVKARIDELLADENMGEAEKAQLEDYKVQCDELIEIINTPKAYFSLRFFYLVWDFFAWVVDCIVGFFTK